MPVQTFSVPAKTILFGEHAVVYGYSAIAVPVESLSLHISISPNIEPGKTEILDKNSSESYFLSESGSHDTWELALNVIRKELDINRLPAFKIEISSTIPKASGLGSSAAFSVCLTKAITAFLGYKLSLEKINEIAYEVEKLHHGTPSGIDNTVITYNRPIFFRKESPVEFIKLIKPLYLVIGDTGIQSRTSETVGDVRKKYNESPAKINTLFNQIDKISYESVRKLRINALVDVGQLMNENHELLRQLDVSCRELDILVNTAISAGALGAKMCGSGRGGNMIALTNLENISQIVTALKDAGASNCYIATIKAG